MNIYKWIVLVTALALFSSCVNDHGNPTPAQACQSTGQDSVTFQKDILPILSTNCALASCHSGSAPAGDLNMERSKAYSQLSKSGTGYLIPYNPNSSLLYSQLVSVSQPMPPTGSLDICNIQLIKNWIAQGAKNN